MRDAEAAEASLDELALLVDTAGAEPVELVLQRRDRPDPATYIGSGKAEELRELSEALDIDLVVFDDELTPAQQRNLEKLFSCDVVDRVALILDIFAQHAHSQEGMVQVELAQLRYRLPRLRGRGKQLSQQGAGGGARGGLVGNRGPGETQLEVDRRRILERVRRLEKDLDRLGRTRCDAAQGPATARVRHAGAGRLHERGEVHAAQPAHRTPTCSCKTACSPRSIPPRVGSGSRAARSCCCPTPSGSCAGSRTSSSRPSVPRSKKWSTPTCSSTWSTARRTTPRSRSRPCTPCCARSVPTRCPSCSWSTRPTSPTRNGSPTWCASHHGAVTVSAVTGDGVDPLLDTIAARLRAMKPIVELEVPYERGDVVAALHRDGEVLVEVHGEGGTRVRARLPAARPRPLPGVRRENGSRR